MPNEESVMKKYISQAEQFVGDIAGQAAHEWYQGDFEDPAEALSSGALTFTDREMHEVYCAALEMAIPLSIRYLWIEKTATFWQKGYQN